MAWYPASHNPHQAPNHHIALHNTNYMFESADVKKNLCAATTHPAPREIGPKINLLAGSAGAP
jgi:hypothetical protein